MTESEVTQDIAAILLGVLFCGVILFITFLPQIDRLVEKWRNKPRLIIPNYTRPRGKDHSP